MSRVLVLYASGAWHLASGTDLGDGNGVPALVGSDVVLPVEVSTLSPSFRSASQRCERPAPEELAAGSA